MMKFWENSTACLLLPFGLLIFKIFFIHGEILVYTYQFYFFRVIMMCTVSENQSRFFRFPEIYWVVYFMVSLWAILIRCINTLIRRFNNMLALSSSLSQIQLFLFSEGSLNCSKRPFTRQPE